MFSKEYKHTSVNTVLNISKEFVAYTARFTAAVTVSGDDCMLFDFLD